MVWKDHSDAGYIAEDDLVMGIVINGEARAYPHNIGWRHEIGNDVVGGQPLVISFCPLTETGMVFNGLGVDGTRITCDASGLLFNNNQDRHLLIRKSLNAFRKSSAQGVVEPIWLPDWVWHCKRIPDVPHLIDLKTAVKEAVVNSRVIWEGPPLWKVEASASR